MNNRIIVYLTVGLFAVLLFSSWMRFMVNYDYIVTYEAACDPYSNVCFIGCEDAECFQPYYYANMQKYAADLYRQCGNDIRECKEAEACLPGDRSCTITYCDPRVDGQTCENENL